MKMRLSKILASAGVASRRACEKLIDAGRVAVNGEIITTQGEKACPETDQITVDGQPVESPQTKVYYLLHKPKGCVCSNRPTKNGKRVVDLFAHLPFRLFTVGRLDKDTTGLLIVTNDGELAKQIIHPSSDVTKEYLVKCAQGVQHAHLLKLQEGAFVQGKWVTPYSIRKVRRGTLLIAIKEGRKHEVRCLVKRSGLSLISLRRVRIGNLRLGQLAEGQFREISRSECEQALA